MGTVGAQAIYAQNVMAGSSSFMAGTGWLNETGSTTVTWNAGRLEVVRPAAAGPALAMNGNPLGSPVPTGALYVYTAFLVSAPVAPVNIAAGARCLDGGLGFLASLSGTARLVGAAQQWVYSDRLALVANSAFATVRVGSTAPVPIATPFYVHRAQLSFRPFTVWSAGGVR